MNFNEYRKSIKLENMNPILQPFFQSRNYKQTDSNPDQLKLQN